MPWRVGARAPVAYRLRVGGGPHARDGFVKDAGAEPSTADGANEARPMGVEPGVEHAQDGLRQVEGLRGVGGDVVCTVQLPRSVWVDGQDALPGGGVRRPLLGREARAATPVAQPGRGAHSRHEVDVNVDCAAWRRPGANWSRQLSYASAD